ncbi:hybrid sensor histidine kinase/response regulator [Thauera sedimentorum]|nr:PAS domain S-box protein [Thauera sedimentorum]
MGLDDRQMANPQTVPSRRASDLRLRQILDQTGAVVFWKDADGRYQFVNKEFCRLVGRAEADILGRRDVDVMPRAVARRLRENDALVLERMHTVTFEEQLLFHGELRTYLVDKFPLRDAAGQAYAVCGVATDITARKRIEEALQSASLAVSGAFGRTLFQELVRFLATTVDADWAFISVRESETSCRMRVLAMWADGEVSADFDYDLRGTPCETVVGERFRIYPQGLCELFPGDLEFGRQRMDSYAGYPLTDGRGTALGLIAVVSRRPLADARFVESVLKIFAVRAAAELERDRMERELRASEASYRAIFEASEDCIFIHDIDTGAIVDVNPRACRVYGYDHDTLLRMNPGQLGSGEQGYTDEDARRWMARARDGEVVRVEWRRRNADGSLHWDEVVLKRIRLAGQERILAVTRDITARKVVAEAIARSENRLRATVEAALDCIITMDEDGLIRGFNPAAEACFGHPAQAVLGRSLADTLIPPRHREAHRQGMARFLREGRGPFIGRRVEVCAQRADGSEFPAELAIAVAEGAEGRLFVGYLRDITAAKRAQEDSARLEAQLRQAQKMEAIGHLAGGIAHDFNNILTSINGYLALAGERQTELGDARLGRYLEQAGLAAGRARDLIRQMLAFSRGQRATLRPLSLSALVAELGRFLGPTLPSSIGFEVDPGADPACVLADPVQLEQVVMNLCINARDALGGRGAIRVAVERLPVVDAVCASCRAALSGEFVAVTVSDDGPGVDPAAVERIFEPFFSTKEVGKGSGMGLAMVHGIVHEHRGHVLLDSVPGEGSRFRVLLPALPGEAAGCEGTRSAAPARGGEQLSGRVLLADDEEMVLAFLRELFEGWGLQVSAEADGAAAARRFAERPDGFDLVVTDQTMPRMTGLELAQAVHRLRPGLPVVLITGYADGIDADRLGQSGVSVMNKPVDPAALYARLAEVLRPVAAPGKP